MKQWPVQDAKARFSELLDASMEEGPQLVSKRGQPRAVLVSIDEWEDLQKRARPTLKELLLAPEPRFDLEIPDRGRLRRRKPQGFE
ncbi:type II toxin-antitoxin system Phd/YefM family antitoxin [Rhizobium tubonense]|uniref:Antitoxin n=1 Tax=Rhizobium tubonense TaxID=484088 RepID=A0A2W4ET07_9HYPH|nr:type II toxin-antitoxin system Phd/YefM family antitoxin [Rhizobium tubonense]PZM13560.1 prevent-host-death protein [Rhizobium tubonense]